MCIYISMSYRRKRPVVWLTFSSPRFLKIKLRGHYLWPGQAFRSRSWDVIDYQYQVRKNTFKVGFTQCHKPTIWGWWAYQRSIHGPMVLTFGCFMTLVLLQYYGWYGCKAPPDLSTVYHDVCPARWSCKTSGSSCLGRSLPSWRRNVGLLWQSIYGI